MFIKILVSAVSRVEDNDVDALNGVGWRLSFAIEDEDRKAVMIQQQQPLPLWHSVSRVNAAVEDDDVDALNDLGWRGSLGREDEDQEGERWG